MYKRQAENKVLDELKSSGCNVIDVPDKAPWQEACAKVISENTSDQAELYLSLIHILLIADDEKLEREALAELVQRRFEREVVLEVAENGRKAADTAVLWGADLILMDIEMPGMSGLDAARAVLAQRPSCRVIFVTDVYKRQVNIYALGAGAEKFRGVFDNTEIYHKLAELTGVQ